jgi:hypothetical protein
MTLPDSSEPKQTGEFVPQPFPVWALFKRDGKTIRIPVAGYIRKSDGSHWAAVITSSGRLATVDILKNLEFVSIDQEQVDISLKSKNSMWETVFGHKANDL